MSVVGRALTSNALGGLPFPDPLQLLNTADVGALWGIAPITLRIWRLKGEGPRFIKLGRNVRYRRSDIETWLDSRSVASTSETLP